MSHFIGSNVFSSSLSCLVFKIHLSICSHKKCVSTGSEPRVLGGKLKTEEGHCRVHQSHGLATSTPSSSRSRPRPKRAWSMPRPSIGGNTCTRHDERRPRSSLVCTARPAISDDQQRSFNIVCDRLVRGTTHQKTVTPSSTRATVTQQETTGTTEMKHHLMRHGITISWDCGLSGRIRNPVRPSSVDPFEDTDSSGDTATDSCGDQYHVSSRQLNIRTKAWKPRKKKAGVAAKKLPQQKGSSRVIVGWHGVKRIAAKQLRLTSRIGRT